MTKRTRGPGRPPAEGVARDAKMQIRVLVEERARYHRAARLAGYEHTADWIRHVLNRAADVEIEKK